PSRCSTSSVMSPAHGKRSVRAPHRRAPAPIFAALGDEVRLSLVRRLSTDGAMSIVRLSEGQSVTRQAITKHLHVLEGVGLVHGARSGRETVWTLDPEPLYSARGSLEDISRNWDAALGRLRALVEE